MVAACTLGCCSKADERIDLTQYVHLDPGPPPVDLHRGSGQLTVHARTVSQVELRNLRLEVKSEACSARVSPVRIDRLPPGDRKPFSVALSATSGKPRDRYPLLLTLHADGLPVPAGIDILVDTRPPADKGWIPVGKVKLVHRDTGRATFYLLAALPLLLIVGWLLWRHSRRSGTERSVRSP